MDLENLCILAKQAALEAGQFIADSKIDEFNISHKEGGENLASCVVTEIDIKAEKIILDTLSPTFSDIGLLAEESASDSTSRFKKNYFWCIDPLDGTLAFSKGEDGYSTSIALVDKKGIPHIGVVYNPKEKNLYWAIKDKGAYKNDIPFKAPNNRTNLTLLYDQSYLNHPLYKDHIDGLKLSLKELGLNELNIHPLGGAVMNGISTIEYAPALYYKFPKKAKGGGSIWDFAASSIIQKEAGGFNSDFFGNPIDLNRADCTFMNHKGIIYISSKELFKIIPSN